MHGVASQKDAAARISLGDRAASRPDAGAEPFDLERKAKRAVQMRLAVNGLGRQAGTGVKQHEAPHGVHGIDDPNVRPSAVTIDGDEERGWPTTTGLEQIGRAEVHVYPVAERLAVDTDAH